MLTNTTLVEIRKQFQGCHEVIASGMEKGKFPEHINYVALFTKAEYKKVDLLVAVLK